MKVFKVAQAFLFPWSSWANLHATRTSTAITTDPSLFKRVQFTQLDGRDLVEDDPARLQCFWDCVDQGMTAEQCEDYIKSVLGEDLSGHIIPDLEIKINRPRPLDWVRKTYFMIGIPVNIYGEVDCDINGGTITYPWTWTVSGQNYDIPDTDCLGLSATDCCDLVMANIAGEGIPLSDEFGYCLSCWVHQELLEPYVPCDKDETGLVYLEHLSIEGVCSEVELEVADVNAADTEVMEALNDPITGVLPRLQAVIDTNGAVECSVLHDLWRDLLFYGRSFPRAMSRIPQLLCGLCDDLDATVNLSPDYIKDLKWIKKELIGTINSAENCIVIYTDRQGLVLEPPKIGGSRAELDFDRDDPKCEEEPCCAEQSMVFDEVTGTCVSCEPGGIFNEETKACDPSPNSCPGDQILNALTDECECSDPTKELWQGQCVVLCGEPAFVHLEPDGHCGCALGTELWNGQCVLPCEIVGAVHLAPNGECGCVPEEEIWNNACIPICLPPRIHQEPSGACACPVSGQEFDALAEQPCACPEGQVVNPTSTACIDLGPGACPAGTFYNSDDEFCRGCGCGFCPSGGLLQTNGPCCEVNANGNNCKSAGQQVSSDKGCRLQDDFYPGYSDQSGNSCSGVEVKGGNIIGVGCGCKPNAYAPCTYIPNDVANCFVCSVADLVAFSGAGQKCEACRLCLLDQCADDWGSSGDTNSATCVSMLNGIILGTAVEWTACLQLDVRRRARHLRSGERGLQPVQDEDCALECAQYCVANSVYPPN